MRLINVDSLELEEHQDDEQYAILSHTWGKDEVTIKGFEDHIKAIKAKGRPLGSFRNDKIAMTCETARNDGIKYVWIDTCCIDKSSSAELSEAINSMYKWYANSKICYAHLTDISTEDLSEHLVQSRWFTRGWTLQELIAPYTVKFYSKDWRGSIRCRDVADLVSKATGIPQPLVFSGDSLEPFSMAQRMSWGANRQTTRLEDRAYSLMGLVGVNMPLLYGEGDRAFERLQQEIVKISDDQTIFMWGVSNARELSTENVGDFDEARPMLARSPNNFSGCRTITRLRESTQFSLSNQGLHIQMPTFKVGKAVIGILACKDYARKTPTYFGLVLREIYDSGTYTRCSFLERSSKSKFRVAGSENSGIIVEIGQRALIGAETQQLTIRTNRLGSLQLVRLSHFMEEQWCVKLDFDRNFETLAYEAYNAGANVFLDGSYTTWDPSAATSRIRWDAASSVVYGNRLRGECIASVLFVLNRVDDYDGEKTRFIVWIDWPFGSRHREFVSHKMGPGDVTVYFDYVEPLRSIAELVTDLPKGKVAYQSERSSHNQQLPGRDESLRATIKLREVLDQPVLHVTIGAYKRSQAEPSPLPLR